MKVQKISSIIMSIRSTLCAADNHIPSSAYCSTVQLVLFLCIRLVIFSQGIVDKRGLFLVSVHDIG